jgi:hypothetical protein
MLDMSTVLNAGDRILLRDRPWRIRKVVSGGNEHTILEVGALDLAGAARLAGGEHHPVQSAKSSASKAEELLMPGGECRCARDPCPPGSGLRAAHDAFEEGAIDPTRARCPFGGGAR